MERISNTAIFNSIMQIVCKPYRVALARNFEKLDTGRKFIGHYVQTPDGVINPYYVVASKARYLRLEELPTELQSNVLQQIEFSKTANKFCDDLRQAYQAYKDSREAIMNFYRIASDNHKDVPDDFKEDNSKIIEEMEYLKGLSIMFGSL